MNRASRLRQMRRFGGPVLATLATVAALVGAPPAMALYKVVGPNGEVTYTDRPPTDPSRTRQISASGSGGTAVSLPLELQQPASRFPVTLYSTIDCRPCDDGRALLIQRGIPFSERTVRTAEDFRAYQSLVPSQQMPSLQIGGQRMTGFSASEWGSYLDAAGYPRESRLPAGFQRAAATPLAPAQPASETSAAAPATASPSPTQAPPPPAGNAPPGFRF